MKYYIAIQKEATVHTAATRFNIGDIVQIDLTQTEVFSAYLSLQEIILYTDPKQAVHDSHKKYTLEKNNGRPSFFENNFRRSSDKKLLSIYGEDAVFSQSKPVIIIYQIEVNDESILQKVTDSQFLVDKENREKIELQFATVGGIQVYTTDKYAKQENIPSTTISLIDHSKLTHKPHACKIL